MAVSQQTKQDIVQGLLVTKQKAHALEITLRFKREGDEADQVAARAAELSNEIDKLLAQMIDEWLVQSRGDVANLKQTNSKLQRSIRSIQKGVETAQSVVKAIGFIDDAIVIASKFASAVA